MAKRSEPIARKRGKRQAWKALEAHNKEIRDTHLRQLFADDPLANRILPELGNAAEPELKHDGSTNRLIRSYRGAKKTKNVKLNELGISDPEIMKSQVGRERELRLRSTSDSLKVLLHFCSHRRPN